MSLWQFAAGLGGMAFLALSCGFGMLLGPLWFMIDDSHEPGPPQNRRNAAICSGVSLGLAMFCFWLV